MYAKAADQIGLLFLLQKGAIMGKNALDDIVIIMHNCIWSQSCEVYYESAI